MYSNLSLDILSLSLEGSYKYDCQEDSHKQWKSTSQTKRGIRHCIITILNKLYIYVYIKQFYKYWIIMHKNATTLITIWNIYYI